MVTDHPDSRINRRAVVVTACLALVTALAVGAWWGYQNWIWLLNPEVKGSIVDFTKQELGVDQVEVGDWRQGGECIVAEVEVSGGETYRVALVAQNPEPNPYDPAWISQIYTLDDFVSSGDAGCGIIHTPAYVFDKNGERIIG
jgi:hypothetical protein